MARRGLDATLFGEEAFAASIVVERAQILDTALKQVKRDKAAFGMLVKEGERLAEAGNVLAAAANVERLSADEQALEVLTRVATRKGPLSDALSDAARRYKAGELGRAEAARAFLDAVKGGDLASLERGAGDRQPGRGGEGGAGQAARTSGPAGGEFAPRDEPGGRREEGLAPDPNQGTFFQPAYHGSPHRFERFDLHAIGTGEGAQVYGWGLYFAQRRGVAESYRRALTRGQVLVDGRPIAEALGIRSGDAWDFIIQSWPREAERGGTVEAISRRVEAAARRFVRRDLFGQRHEPRLADWDDDVAHAMETLRRQAPAKVEVRQGQLYKVEVPENDVLLDWDKPLSEQPEAVKKALGPVAFALDPEWSTDHVAGGVRHELRFGGELAGTVTHIAPGSPAERFKVEVRHADGSKEVFDGGAGAPGSLAEARRMVQMRTTVGDDNAMMTGRQMYEELVSRHGSPEEASRALNELGVKGLRYLDQGSRGQGEGSHNFVVFDDRAIDVIETYYQGRPGGGEGKAAGEPVVRLTGRELGDFGDDVTALRAAAAEHYYTKLRGTSVTNPALGVIRFSQRGGRKAISAGANPVKLMLFPALPEMLAKANLLRSAPPHRPDKNTKAWHWLETDVEVAGQIRHVGLSVREDANGNFYYNHNVEIGAGPAPDFVDPASKSGGYSQAPSPGSIVGADGELNITLLGEAGEKGEPAPGALPQEPAPGALPQDARAAVEIGADVRRILLGAKSDKTSFMHESAHVFLWLLRELGTDAEAAPGPKIGAFFANLSGKTGYLTMDLWWTRQINRLRGDMQDRIPGLKGAEIDASGNPVGLARFKHAIGKPQISDDEALALLPEYAAKAEEKYRASIPKTKTEAAAAAAAQYLHGLRTSLKEQPDSVADRTFMLEIVRRTQQLLRERGHDLSIADISSPLARWHHRRRHRRRPQANAGSRRQVQAGPLRRPRACRASPAPAGATIRLFLFSLDSLNSMVPPRGFEPRTY